MALVMGIDLGTSSTKTVLMDANGQVVATASAVYPLQTPCPGWVEQHPSDWWKAVCDTTREIVRRIRPTFSAEDIQGVSLSGQMNGAVFVDTMGHPLYDAILWLDQRSQQSCDEANELAGDLLRERALHVLNPINTLAKVLWLRDHEPNLYAEAHHVLIPKDWIRFKMTGTFGADVTDASVTGALDLYRRDWSDDILRALRVRRDLFPAIAESPAVVGSVTEKAARETGLAVNTPVCAGGGDMACMAVGGGVITPGVVSVGIGTAGHVLTAAEGISDAAFNQLWPMCHAVPGKYFWLGCSYTGGASLRWFSDQFGEDFDKLTSQAEGVPAGSDGLFFMPWFQGTATPCPDAHARGGWMGLTLHHTKAHMIRALMEGVVFDLRHSLECFKRLGLPIVDIRIGEGGARSTLWQRIQADVFGHDVRVMETRDVSAIGAAIIAGVGVGVFDSFASACERAIVLGDTVMCDTARASQYETSYRRYSQLYPSLKRWFHGIV